MSGTETASTKRSSVIDKLKNYRASNEGDATFTLPETGVTVSYPKFRKHGVWASALRIAKNKLGKAQILYVCRICLFDGEKLTEADFREYIPMSDANELLAEIFGSDDEDEDDEGNGVEG
ncbi:hypothetical protein SAMN04515647_1676 [Cohaesibacter sp. ES.047]|uniref:hypothetical protein n=1 Tax=Cohaesibacter sp. ES.047 TaxID=1798205 RepID=UPI000BB8ED85|nr:hypothetical protein [Cohaesibacter sp. ES.047]SNY91455.1 hypothetical protein SAMN04515647_1676 [Cohaesibacter sp. ES.047]